VLTQLLVLHLNGQDNRQAEVSSRWRIALTAGIEHHDKRLYDFPQYPSENLLARQPEAFGTYAGSVAIDYRLVQLNDRFKLSAGLGVGYRRETFKRPYTPPQQLIDGFRIQLYSDSRNYTSLIIPVSVDIQIVKRLSLLLVATADVDIFQRTRHSWDNTYGPTDTRPFRLERAAVQGGLNYTIGRKLEVGGMVRILYTERRNFLLIVNRTDQNFSKFDGYNPLQLSLRLARTF
jgi:hypothetical protein